MKISNIFITIAALALVVSIAALCFVSLHKTEMTQTTSVSGTPEGEHVHEYRKITARPTCTEQGFTKYCCACGYSYTDDEVPALGHHYVMDRIMSATEMTPSKGFMRCETCGGIESAELRIHSGTQTGGETESAEPLMQDYTITLHNVMGSADAPYSGLAGTMFKLYRKENGSWITEDAWRKTTPLTGVLTWSGLEEGEYRLEAIKASNGFKLPLDVHAIVFPRDADSTGCYDITLYNEFES